MVVDMATDHEDVGLEQAWLRYVAAREGHMAERARREQRRAGMGSTTGQPSGSEIDLRDVVPMRRSSS